MEAKTILRSFWQLTNVITIVGLQGLGLFFVSYSVGLLVMAVGVRGCPPRPDYLDWYLWLVMMIGLGFLLVSLFYIAFPSVWMQTINQYLALAPTDINLPFFSTHPSYIFLDALFFIPAIALFQSGRLESMCRLNASWGMGWAILLITFFFPIFRAFCWYVLGRKIEAIRIKRTWMPIIWWYIFALPIITFFTYTYLDKKVYPRLRLPVVNEKTFKGGIEQHPEFHGELVRVQGILSREIAKCGLFGKDETKNPYPYGTVLLDMGKRNGQIMIQAKKPREVKMLEIEAKNRNGQIFEAFGRLSKLPDPSKKMICGIGKADSGQKGGLGLLEIEMP